MAADPVSSNPVSPSHVGGMDLSPLPSPVSSGVQAKESFEKYLNQSDPFVKKSPEETHLFDTKKFLEERSVYQELQTGRL